jgi:integrase
MARTYKRGKIHYSDIFFPEHPEADKSGRVRIPLDTDKELATIALGRLIEQRKAARFGRPIQGITWKEFKEKFLPQKAHEVTATLYRNAISRLEKFKPIQTPDEVTPALLAQAKAAWKAEGRGLYIVNRHVRCIKAMMRVAISWGYAKEQKWESVREDKEPQGRLLWYRVEELRRLIKVCGKGPIWKTVALLGARCGLRRSEIYWLSWDDVDFARERIHVSPKADWTPKDHERRWVPMPTDVRTHLKTLQRQGEWVLMEDGKRPSLEGLSVYFKRLVRKAGLKGSIHILRHSYGSHLANGGATPKVIMELMGHSTLDMVNKYLHLAPSTLQDAAKALPDL